MATTAKFLRPITQSLAAITSSYPPISHSRKFFYAKFEPLKTLIKDLEPALRNPASSTFQRSRLITQRKYFRFSGSKLSIGSIFVVSVVLGSKTAWPHVACAMDCHDILLDDRQLLDASDEEEDPKAFWMFARKLWLPVFFFLTVLTNLDHPIALIAIKITLLLLSTNPSPLSVYAFVDQTPCMATPTTSLIQNKVMSSIYAPRTSLIQNKVIICQKS
ncbi:uncharacterized protein LOC132181489 isoform X2 [Corylus avellana]|uniref:uncharacterized protein LOC132181489 isoform X2 n=1 Tax=Corylus avellana TaxID=13451 RepID=UPI00286C55AC|nr:uncharacterized protein LOC132181489 isoform X2 [Corylus avellana]